MRPCGSRANISFHRNESGSRMNIFRRQLTLALAGITVPLAAVAATAPQVIPTMYEAGHFYATPTTTGGQKLRLLVDTGGGGGPIGLYWITVRAAQRLHLKTRTCRITAHYSVTVANLPRYLPKHGLPPPRNSPCGKALLVQRVSSTFGYDGQFSGSYLYAGGVWTFDYPSRRLTLEGDAWRPDTAAHAIHLGFQRNDRGNATFGYPRIVVRVAGRPLNMLLDTGATAHPTPIGEKASATPTIDGIGVTSYITTSVFNRWRHEHPDWRVVPDGDDMFGPRHPMRLIEVPSVKIAGWSVGPVWFTERPDAAFHGMMSSMMDKQVEGSVGANVFRHFVMTIDYPQAVAYFRCARGCKNAPKPPRVP